MELTNLTTAVIFLIVGIGVLLLGMNLMSSGLKKVSGPRIRGLFNKIKNNRFIGLGIGAGTTALIQSSAATSVMTIGFINAGVMSIFQAVSIIMGAYIGTTVTGLLVSLSTLGGGSSFSIDLVFMLLIVVGVILTFFKKELCKNIGEICSGLGLLFLGLFMLNGAFKYSEIQSAFQQIFTSVSNPILLVLIGALLTMLVQSSSAATGIMIVMVAAGSVNVSAAIYVAVGATVGTVITTILATIGGSTNSKRTAAIVFTMRILMAILFLIIFWPVNSAYGLFNTMSSWFGANNTGLFVAVFMVIYNVVTMFMLLPFITPFEKLATKAIKDKQAESMNSYVKFIDNKLLATPALAMMQVKKEIVNMNELTKENFVRAYQCIITQNFEEENLITKTEEGIDYLNN